MAVDTVGFALDKSGALALSCAVDCLFGLFGNGFHVVSVDGDAGNVIGLCADRNVLNGRALPLGNADTVSVVFADEHNGQLPNGGKVQRFVKNSFVGCSVSEKRDGNFTVVLHFAGESGAHGDRNTAADNGVCAEVARVDVGNVHGATAASAISVLLTHKLGESLSGIGALCKAMAVAAVGTCDVIVGIKQFADGGGNGFLAYAKVNRASEHVFLKKFERLIFKIPDKVHCVVDMTQMFFIHSFHPF